MIALNSHFTFSALCVPISSFYVCVCVCYSILRSAVYEPHLMVLGGYMVPGIKPETHTCKENASIFPAFLFLPF